MNENPTRIGLVGTGRIGRNHAAIIAEHIPGARLVAVADPVLDAASDLAARFAGVRAVSSMDELLEADLDAVVVTAPSVLHSALITQAAASGRAVFCEKPAGMDLVELDGAIAAAEEAGWSSRSGSTAGSPPASPRPGPRSTAARSGRSSSCARTPATRGWPIRPGSRRARSSPRPSSTTSTRSTG
ncbi:Gfo/Idh/MocA family oxidoreductase [Tessaracoccus coleopterorum]|uniref:Gfo/Idh/MocA family oxidoreductase n=1 Tax=Tessaracoccus coleopterorum TaxID=2714950 RepID=UPI001E354289|nr:Gfo/Idh/MocA family oxidoreductase [Tessaracoccus coleopterorum]